MIKTKVAIVKCNSYNPSDVRGATRKLMDLLGFDTNTSKDLTLINPNLLSAKAPDRAITTHPVVVRAVSDLFSSNGNKVLVGDSPGGADRGVHRVWKNTGLLDAMKGAAGKLHSFEGNPVVKVSHNGRSFHVADVAKKADLVIGVSKLKTHVLTLMTGALKNCYGFIPGFRKAVYHKEFPKPDKFSAMLVDLYAATKPDLFIMDAILAMEGDGPSSGKPKQLNLLLASTDAVALDSVAATVIGFQPRKIDYLKLAHDMRIGRADLDEIDIIGENIAECKADSFELPSNTKLKMIPDLLVKLISPYIWAHPAIDHDVCIRCDECKDNCPTGAISEDGDKLVYDYNRCIDCMCCHELCPNKAVYIKKSWLARKFIH
ncbi:MAG: DUF362 domain-containing protein [candidate division Zixibacteria bacterium]|nr:DUF362 domain-containing protein [candidate division Zixibacteria bacterium]